MDSTAACIEDLVNNVYGRFPILDVSMPGNPTGHHDPLEILLATASNLEGYMGLFHAVRCIPNGCLAVGLEFGINLRCKGRTWKLPLALNKSVLQKTLNVFESELF